MIQKQETEQSLSPLQRALIALKDARAKLEKYEVQSKEPIAIIGMGCRFPGDASSPEAFWDILQNGVDAITEVPKARWNLDDYYDPDPDTPGKIYTRYGGFIEQLQEFDANFFGISAREAIHLDPQQRLLLEVCWEALEHSGKNPQELMGSKTGVFIGIGSNDYTQGILSQGPEKIDAYVGTGNAHSTASGRISYFLGLTGPSLAIDTACSASLVSIHLACSSLRNQECHLALAGGVNRLISPTFSINFSKARMLSFDGRCKTFDTSADGFVRSEGCGIVVLKRLSNAVADGDRILAVVRGTAINQDGYTSGLTVPNGLSQQAVISQALENGGVDPASVSYIEAHGTGTSLGDPIEVEAIGTVFRKTHSQDRPLIIGSVKTNIGHLEGAAGIAGLMKVVLQLQHQQIAPSLHLKQPNPYINWSELPIQVQTNTAPWQTNGESRTAGVSSFGFSGTNAHVVLEEGPEQVKSQNVVERPIHLLTISAKTEIALSELVSSYQNYLKIHTEVSVADICYTANTGRAHFNHRLAVIASNQQELVEKLGQHKEGKEVSEVFSGKLLKNTAAPKIVFLFTGQGSQYVNMGRQLYEQAPTFRQAINKCEEILSRLGIFHGKSLSEILYPADKDESSLSLLDQTAYTQPALFALEYALWELWQSWGVKPDVIMGHSVGEYVAATVAGVWSLEDGLKLIATRGRLMQQLPSGGEMVSVMASESKVMKTLESIDLKKKVAIAAINGPESIVISGESEAVREIVSSLESQGIKTKKLQVSHAFHSPMMEPMLAEFEAVAKEVTYNQPQIPLISNVSGIQVEDEMTTAEYWVSHILQPVQFAKSMKTLHDEGYKLFLEIGPKPILLGMGRQCWVEDMEVWLPSLRPPKEEWQQILESLGQLYVKGIKVDWLGFDREYNYQKVVLPTYPFQRQQYWIEASENEQKSSLTENSNTAIVNLLSKGKIDTLAQELEKVGNLSQSEIDLLPKLLDLLSKQHQQQLETETVSIKDWFYQVEWRKTAIFSQLQSPDYLPTPPEVEKQLTSTLKELVTGLDNDRSEQIQTCLEELSIDYIVQALQEMSWPYKPTDSFSIDSAASRLGIVKSQRQLFNRMLQMLASVGIVQSTQQQWQVLQTLEKVDPSEKSQKLLSQYPDEEAALILLHRCASQLSGVLRGAVEPVQLVFPEGDLTTATRLYQESPAAKVMNTIVQKAIAKAIEKLPQHRELRILEIGAGTGGTTSYILPDLPPTQTEYVFSDLGTLFTTKAKQKFSEYPFVQYQTLDIEVEPVNQGFEPHQYDMVIAANVLHATANIKQTLSHVKQLLMPGGMLLLLEGTTPQKWIDLIFGLLEGWWKFQDYELRPDYPLLSRSKWKQVLSETGFTQQVALPDIEGMAECLSRQSVIVAETDETTVEVKSREPKSWLILADTQGVAQQLANQMRSVGEQCTLVFTGEKYQQLASEEFTINPRHPEEFEELIANVAAYSNSKLYGVVQCWTTEAFVGKEISFLELENLSQLGCGTTLSVVQALVKSSLSQPPRLWLVTSGTQPVPESNPVIPGVAQSPVWGMGKAIDLEHPELSCMQIDLDPTETIENQAWVLFNEIWSDDRENQVAWRGNSRYVARLMRSSHQQTEVPLNFREDASYLITGGMGGLGLLVASWMVSQGAKHLVLLGRRSPDNAALKKLTELEQAGAQVVVEKADVSDGDSMQLVFENINQSSFPLAGVIHSAGVLSDGTLPNQSWSSFEKVMSPKVQGGWHLHQLTKNLELDFFVLFSSMASLLGSPGQGNHSAANSFLDGLAHYRRSMGLPGLSIHWGAVSQVGEAAERGADIKSQQQGLGAMTPNRMLECLEQLMSGSDVEVGIAPIDWSMWQERINKWPLLEDWKEITTSTTQESKSDFLQQLEAATASEKQELLVSLVRTQVAKVLGMSNGESIGLDEGFFELGMDSLTSVELRNKLQTILGCSISSTLAFDYPTMGELIDYLAQQLLEKADYSDTSTQPMESEKNKKQEDSLAKTKELSEEQLEELINQKLNSLIN